ncbi:MAG: hypothetical protein IKX56_00945, partial [Muribaculaceae bacterium]|nr:hypothetical protein [Muribaculaceae bacterium]
MTKKSILLLVLTAVVCLSGFASQRTITLNRKGNVGNHFDQPVLADQPDVYYDDDNLQIIIDGGGEVTYYDVEITSMTTWYVVISTQVNGYYDTIDVSSLASGDYIITISSPTGHEFEGE